MYVNPVDKARAGIPDSAMHADMSTQFTQVTDKKRPYAHIYTKATFVVAVGPTPS